MTTPRGRPFQRGHDPRRNVTTPGAGRPPDAWRATLAELATRDATLAHIAQVLEAGPEHPQFFRALAYATDHGVGKATQPLTHASEDGGPLHVVLRVPEPDDPWPPRLAAEGGA